MKVVAEKRNMRVVAFVLGVIVAASGDDARAAAPPAAKLDSQSGRVVLTNGRLELVIETRPIINPCSLRDLKSGRVYADGNYAWCERLRPTLIGKPVIAEKNGVCSVTLEEQADTLEIEQMFFASAAEPDLITEQIKLHNPGRNLVIGSLFSCGFTKKLHDGKAWLHIGQPLTELQAHGIHVKRCAGTRWRTASRT